MYIPDGWDIDGAGQATACTTINGKSFRTQWYKDNIIVRAKQSCGDSATLYLEVPKFLPSGAARHWFFTYGRSYYVIPNSLIITSGIPKKFIGRTLYDHEDLIAPTLFVPSEVMEYRTAAEAALSLNSVFENLTLSAPE